MNKKALKLGILFWIAISPVKAIGADGTIKTGQSSSDYQIVDDGEYGFRIENKTGTINYSDYQASEGTFNYRPENRDGNKAKSSIGL